MTLAQAPEPAQIRLDCLRANPAEQVAFRNIFAGPGGFIPWLTCTGWTFDPRRAQGDQLTPFVPWECQTRAGAQLVSAIDVGRDVLIDKSRDMGASWLCLAAFLWYWLFRPTTPLLLVSRKEALVDQPGNPDTLFWKLDYLLDHLPAWLQPRRRRSYMHLLNLDNLSVIDGEATTGDVSRGGRRKAIMLDEFAAVPPQEAQAALSATADATPCRIFNSTPQGRGNAFAEVRFSGKVQIVTLHWHEHPEKGKGATLIDGAWTSPWYAAECARRVSRKEVAQELDIDYLASGDSFFDLEVLQRLRMSGQIREATHIGDLEGEAYREHSAGRLWLWVPLVKGRPSQERNYAAFADISHGTGASNSVLKVACADTGEVVATYASPEVGPHEFAQVAVRIVKWFGGQRPCILGWEANGPGQMFGAEVYRLGYGHVLGNQDARIPWKPEDNKIGWWSTPGPTGSKVAVLGDLRGRLARGEIIEHDSLTVAELERYITGKDGTPMSDTTADVTTGARASHGDRVIALAGLTMCLDQQAKARGAVAKAPAMSYRAIREEAMRRESAKREW